MQKKSIFVQLKWSIFPLALLSFLLHAVVQAQPPAQFVKVIVAADHTDWTYKTGEPVNFKVTVLKDGNPLKNIRIKYEVGPEKMEPVKKDSLLQPTGVFSIPAVTLKNAGFLQCIVIANLDGKEYRGIGAAGFEPSSIQPTVANPTDFLQFWDNAKAELAKIPLDARMTILPDRCTENVNVYQVNIQNYKSGARLYGILCIPKKEGKYPALLRVPGAGIRSYKGDIATAEKGIITLEIGIHGIPVNLDESVYANLGAGALNNYPAFNLDNKDRYYYKRVYLGCIRANDFLFSLPQFDGVNLAVTGGSQGGALSIVTAALDTRVKCLGAFYPALCDVTGYLHGRAGGWPHLFNKDNIAFNNSKEKIETCGYYDVVNFARQLKVPGMYSWGYNDETCPPTSMFAAYNVITAPKTLWLALETGHWTYPEQDAKMIAWLIDKLKPAGEK
ncbi:MAG: acetylxylan esterase [Chitinophagaceae bacterium]|nr:acetylxylan esterase [Chitinophagaceae bacterium]